MGPAVVTRVHRLGLFVVVTLAMWGQRAWADIRMNPDPLDAGGVLVGGMNSVQGTLSSDDNIQVDLEVVNCNGGGGSLTVSPSADINLNAPKTITLTFMPDARGLRSCTVRVYEKNTTNQLDSFQVRGTGQTDANISINGPFDFGSVRYRDGALAGSTSSRNLSVANTGDRTLNITNVQIVSGASEFSITNGGTTAAIGGTPASWTVQFNPSAAGMRAGTIRFTSNDPDMGTRDVNLVGIGTTATIATTPPTADFMTVQTGSSRNLDITISNTATTNRGALGVTTATLTNNGEGWFGFSASTCNNSTTSCTFNLQIGGTPALVGVRCRPPVGANATPRTATLTFANDADTTTSDSVTLTCVAGFSDVAAEMPTVDFGPLLVNTTGMTTVNLRNNGTTAADYTIDKTGANASQFNVTGPTTVNPSSTVTLNITFTPTIEGPVSAGIDINLSTGGGPSISLDGRGTDRHIRVLDMLEAPTTFRNPGSMAPLVDVLVENTGEYPLSIENIEIGGDTQVWSLAQPFEPFTVPGLGSVAVPVRFAPVTEGKSPDGTVVITSDDRLTPTKMLLLTGTGRLRNVDMTPGSVDVGDTFAGIATHLSIARPGEVLLVTNMDDTPFMIREIKVEGEQAEVFEVQNADGVRPENVMIMPGETQQFDVVFSPRFVGDFEATLALYLDEDHVSQTPVPIRGRALWVDAHGSGGCSTSGGSGLGLALGLLLLRRRRR